MSNRKYKIGDKVVDRCTGFLGVILNIRGDAPDYFYKVSSPGGSITLLENEMERLPGGLK